MYITHVVTEKLVELLPVELSPSVHAFQVALQIRQNAEPDEYSIGFISGRVVLAASSPVRLLAAAGHYIRDCLRAGGLLESGPSISIRPAIPSRIIYAPGHFRNSYEEASYEQMRALMTEAAFWGADTWGDWFDTNDMTNPYGSDVADSRTSVLYWENKLDLLKAAQEVGLSVHLWMSPNHVFVDQVTKDSAATKELSDDVPCLGRRKVHGNLVCPSKPAGRQIILENDEALLDDLVMRGIRLDVVSFGFYDNGGCLCDSCRPWVDTALSLAEEVRGLVLRRFPDCRFDIVGWYLSSDEIARIEDRYDAGELQWAEGLQIALSGGSRDVSPMRQLRRIGKELFVNLGYSADNVDDVYGLCGAVVAPRRLNEIVEDSASSGCLRIVGYGEGIHDDINKVLFLRLATEPNTTPERVLSEYAQWYFRSGLPEAARIASLLASMEGGAYTWQPELQQALSRLGLEEPESVRDSWRFRQLEYRLALCRLDSQIGRPRSWDDWLFSLLDRASSRAGSIAGVATELLDGLRRLVDRRHSLYRRMNAEVYGIGVFGLFELPKRQAFSRWEAEVRSALRKLPPEVTAAEIREALEAHRAGRVESED
jgi:hypothetical protein